MSSLKHFTGKILCFVAVYVSVGYYHDHIGLMLALDAMQLLDSGERNLHKVPFQIDG